MWITVFNPEGDMLYGGNSWPMARAALDHLLMECDGCPSVTFTLTAPDSATGP